MVRFWGLVVMGCWTATAFASSYHWQRGDGVDLFREQFHQAIGELRDAGLPIDAEISNEALEKDLPVLDEGRGDFQRYLEELVLNAEDLRIEGDDGRVQVHMSFLRDQLRFPFGKRSEREYGQAYAVSLARDVRFTVFYSNEVIYASDLTGLQVLVKLPLVPDELTLRQFTFNLQDLRAAVRATAVYDYVELVARASVRLRHFEGIDWFIPVLDALPGFFDGARFRVNPTRPSP